MAETLGVNTTTGTYREKGHTQPATRLMPALLAFVGYNPVSEALGIVARLKRARVSLGLSQEKLAELFLW